MSEKEEKLMFMLGEMSTDIKTIKESMGGLVKDVEELKEFRTNVKTKVAVVSGFVGFMASQWHYIINIFKDK